MNASAAIDRHEMEGADGVHGAGDAVRDAAAAVEIDVLATSARDALARYVLAIADDAMLIGHRDSEWTGLGPILEEDIAFSSMAQDEIGHALVLYGLLHEHFGAPDPDDQAFLRDAPDWRNTVLCELPRMDYAYSLIRRALYDLGAAMRYEALTASAWPALASAATKLAQEKKYHLIHDRAFIGRLGRATEESHDRLQRALDTTFAHALAMWEPVEGESELVEAQIVPASAALQQRWLDRICTFLVASGLTPPAHHDGAADAWVADVAPADVGGRKGIHSEHLVQLLDAMQGMYRSEPGVNW